MRASPDSCAVWTLGENSRRSSVIGICFKMNRSKAGASRISAVPGIRPGSKALAVMPAGRRLRFSAYVK